MLLSFNWLKKYVNLPDSISAEEVAQRLTMSTVEVERVENRARDLENIVVGRVIEAEKHPNADKLKVCVVDVGEEEIKVVCGGSNVRQGMLVALAKVGAKVRWHGEGDLVELKPVKVRGVESFGMICSATEIGLEGIYPLKNENEILDLTPVLSSKREEVVGESLAEALNLDDTILEVDNKSISNRPDLWGHYGIAREVAVLYNKPLKDLKVEKLSGSKNVNLKINIEDKENCYRYIGAVVGGIKIAPSPMWLQNRLMACGVRPINNIVDITNYVTLELGRPSHAFDRRDIKGDTIIVRRAKAGEKFTTLDGQVRALTEQMCLVCDAEKPVDLGGIMGGLNSGIKDDTTEIILELANFNPANIRRVANALGLRTEAAVRFEKGLAPYLAEVGLQRIITLIKELIPDAKLISKIVDVNNQSESERAIELPVEFLNKKIGVAIEKKIAIDILNRLGFSIKEDKKSGILKATVPKWRSAKDISIPEDLVEEVIRIFGYDKIPVQLPAFVINPPEENKLLKLTKAAREALAKGMAYTEVYNYSFVSPGMIQNLGDDVKKYIELDNPLSQERPYLRQHLVINLLENVIRNIADYPSLRLFEIGKTFIPEESGPRAKTNSDELLPRQDTWLTAVYINKKDSASFWQARRVVENICAELGYEFTFKFPSEIIAWQHPSRAGQIIVSDNNVGAVFEIHPLVIEKLGWEWSVGVAEINLDKLVELSAIDKKYALISEFPPVERDLSILVKKEITHSQILLALQNINPLLSSVELFDVYEGEKIAAGYKSMAYHFVYRSPDRTLAGEEVDKAQERVKRILQDKLGAEIRE